MHAAILAKGRKTPTKDLEIIHGPFLPSCNVYFKFLYIKREVSWGFRPLLSVKMVKEDLHLATNNSRTTRGKKSAQFLKGTTRDLFQRVLETKMRELEKR